VNYYPFHIGDYLSATRHLSWEEDAAFRRLLDTYYTTEKALPIDLRAVCRLVLATTESQREAVKQVLSEFFELTPDGWVNHRADAEIAEMQERQHVAKVKANKRWDMHRAELSKATAMLQHKESDATAQKTGADAMLPTPTPTPTPIKNTKNTKKTATIVATPDGVCESVWADYLKTRKTKLTQTAIDGIKREAEIAGWPIEQALRECCARGWTGFKADWVAKVEPKTPSHHASFKAQDDRIARERWEQMTGETHPDNLPKQAHNVIDFMPQLLEMSQ